MTWLDVSYLAVTSGGRSNHYSSTGGSWPKQFEEEKAQDSHLGHCPV